jgi:hypothetical protein
MTAGRVEPMRQILNQSLFARRMTVEFKNKITETYFVETSAHYLQGSSLFRHERDFLTPRQPGCN